MRVRYLKPIKPVEGEDAADFARRTQLQMAEAKGVPATSHSFFDVILAGTSSFGITIMIMIMIMIVCRLS